MTKSITLCYMWKLFHKEGNYIYIKEYVCAVCNSYHTLKGWILYYGYCVWRNVTLI